MSHKAAKNSQKRSEKHEHSRKSEVREESSSNPPLSKHLQSDEVILSCENSKGLNLIDDKPVVREEVKESSLANKHTLENPPAKTSGGEERDKDEAIARWKHKLTKSIYRQLEAERMQFLENQRKNELLDASKNVTKDGAPTSGERVSAGPRVRICAVHVDPPTGNFIDSDTPNGEILAESSDSAMSAETSNAKGSDKGALNPASGDKKDRKKFEDFGDFKATLMIKDESTLNLLVFDSTTKATTCVYHKLNNDSGPEIEVTSRGTMNAEASNVKDSNKEALNLTYGDNKKDPKKVEEIDSKATFVCTERSSIDTPAFELPHITEHPKSTEATIVKGAKKKALDVARGNKKDEVGKGVSGKATINNKKFSTAEHKRSLEKKWK